jgi:sterol desaturase/sphingolipid hydroxylase (fatty acid hydroxylase superfamily)
MMDSTLWIRPRSPFRLQRARLRARRPGDPAAERAGFRARAVRPRAFATARIDTSGSISYDRQHEKRARPVSRMRHLPEIFLAVSLAMIAVEAALAGASVLRARYRTRDTFASLGMQVGNVVMNLVMAGTVYAGLSAVYEVRLFTISRSSAWAWVAIFFLDDFTYYWFHRISHECRFWWAAHVNHHSSQEYNLSTALRQSWTSVIVGTWTPWIPLAFLGFPPGMILLQQSFNLFYQFWIHTESVHRMPAWFEYLFNTPSNHRVHHASNPRYLDRNYAGVLMAWDRLFGTFAAERDAEPPRYGIVKNIGTFNPIRIAFHEWAAILRELVAARSPREALGVVFGPPGWRADGKGLTSRNIRAAWQAESRLSKTA